MTKYRSCHSVEGELFFNHLNKVGYCCMITPSGGQPVLYSDYKGETINWDNFFENRENHIELMKNGSSLPACDGCFWIREKDWPERKNEFKYILLNVWTKCNLFCSYCDTHSNKYVIENTKEYDIYSVIKDMIDKHVITPNTKIDIAGGESTLDKNFNNFLNLLLESGIKNININTNATIYAPSIYEGIKQGAVSVITSLDSGSSNMFTKIKKKNLWKKTWDNLKKYSSAVSTQNSNSVRAKYIILPGINDSKNEIENFLCNAKKHGLTGVILNIDQNWVKDNWDNPEHTLKIFELTKFFIKISSMLNIDWQIWAHIEDLLLRHNKQYSDKSVDVSIIFDKSANFNLKNEFKEKLLLKLKTLF